MAIGAATAVDAVPAEEDNGVIIISDITAHGFGIGLAGGKTDILINAQSNLPAVKKKNYTTQRDNQTTIVIPILEGDNPKTEDNAFLAELELGIDPAPKGTPRIEVTYSIDETGMVKVVAHDLNSGKVATVMPTRTVNLSIEEVEMYRQQNEGLPRIE